MDAEVQSDSRIAKITIHHSELKLQSVLVQPVVCMHIVDSNSGTYVKKQDRNRAVMSFYENQRDIDYIMPVMTQPCTVQGGKCQILNWEESFVLNESLHYLLKPELGIIIFFEVIDLIPMSFTKYHYERLNENGMQKVAWGFIKVIGPNNIKNIGTKLHLQLYKPYPVQKGNKSSKLEVFQWWSKKTRVPLEASLLISFNPYEANVVEPALRSMLPLQKEVGSLEQEKTLDTSEDVLAHSFESTKRCISSGNKTVGIKWQRKEGENCKIPNKFSLKLEATSNCQILKFSSLGRCLVAGVEASSQYYLSFYDIPSGIYVDKTLAHSDVIYDIDWSEDDSGLLSASADYSVKLWKTKPLKLLATFIHPSFVYSAKFQPLTKNVLVTACYDHVIRIWSFNKSIQLLQEMENHKTSVNALCWNMQKVELFSADSIGEIKIWKISKNMGFNHYALREELSLEEIKGVPISKLIYDHNRNTLFLFCADRHVRLLNLSLGKIFQSCRPSIKSPTGLHGCCSPCGNLLFLCNDDGSVSVCKYNFSEISEKMSNSLHKLPLTSIDYHPCDHSLVLSSTEEDGAIYIYTCDSSEKSPIESLCSQNNTPEAQHVGSKKTPLKDKKKSYLYSTETSSDEGCRQLSVNTLTIQNCLSESSSTTLENSHKFLEKGLSQPFTAVITKSGQFSVISGGGSSTETDTYGSGNTSESGNPGRLSSKRAQRREKLKHRTKDSS